MTPRTPPPASRSELVGRLPAAPAALAVLAWTIGALSAQPREPIRIEYRAPSACPTEASFLAQVRARTGRTRPAQAGERARTFVVTITHRDKRVKGSLLIRDVDGKEADRDVSGASCEEVVAALSLVAALAVDPNALTTASVVVPPAPPATAAPPPAPPGTTAPSAPVSTAPVSTAGEPPGPAAEHPSVEKPHTEMLRSEQPTAGPKAAAPGAPSPPTRAQKPPRRRPKKKTPAPPAAPSPLPPDTPWQTSFGLHVALDGGVAPEVLIAAPIFLEVRRSDPQLVSPVVRLDFERSGTGPIDMQEGSASFTWTAGGLDVCPIGWTLVSLRFYPCARVQAGVLEGAGATIVRARSEVRSWLSVGVMGRVRWTLVGPVFLEGAAGIRFPLFRDRFFFAPDTTIYRPPAAGWTVSAGGGLLFL